MAEAQPSKSPEVHPAFSRPGLLAALAIAAGHSLAAGAWNISEGWLIGGAVVCVLCLLIVSVRRAAFVAAFCVLWAIIGGVQEFRLAETARAAFRQIDALPETAVGLVEVEGVVAAPPRLNTYSSTVMLEQSIVGVAGAAATLSAPVAVRVKRGAANDAALAELVPGQRFIAKGPLMELPHERSSGESGDWLRNRGAVAAVQARVVEVLPGELNPWQRVLRSGRRTANQFEALLNDHLEPENAAVLSAMTLGRTYHLTDEQRAAFRRCGLAHIFAVSGLHTMLIGGLVIWLLRVVGLPFVVRFAMLGAALVFFAALVDMRTSILRASLLLMAWEGRHLLHRPVEPMAALGSIASILMLLDPRAVWQIDFQMTFLAAATLMAMSPWLFEMQKVVGRRFGWSWRSVMLIRGLQLAAASAVIQLALVPILVGQFGEVSLIAPLANLLLLPIMALSIKLCFGLFILSHIVPALSDALMPLLNWPADVAGVVTAILSDLPGAAVSGVAWPLPVAALFYVILTGGSWNRFRGPRLPRASKTSYAISALALVAVMSWVPMRWGREPLLTMWFLDVGQGDAILIQARGVGFALIDAGPEHSAWALPGMLRDRGVDELQFAVATHSDADHIGGLAEVIDEITVRRLFVGGTVASSDQFEEVVAAVESSAVPVSTVRRGATMTLGETTIEVLHPTDEFLEEGDERNAASVVMRVLAGGRAILLTGDAEDTAERSMLIEGLDCRADVLKLGHHGSVSSTSSQFLQAVSPEFAVASCGRNNRYGHPSGEVLHRCDTIGAQLWRTDQDGSIKLIVTEGGEMLWETTRRLRP